MKKRLLGFTALSSLLFAIFFFAVLPVRGEGVDERIKALEERIAKLRAEQMEFKKEATEAAAALPSFRYRPGDGATIEAADRSWSIGFSHLAHFRIIFESGKDHRGRTNGEVEGRRFRSFWTMCINNCFYELHSRLDLDGFDNNSDLQRAAAWIHFENWNPWLPTLYFGMDIPSEISNFRRGSSAVGAQAEYDLLSRNNGFNTGRMGNGVGINWDDKPLSSIGIPGRVRRFNFAVGHIGESDDGASAGKDRKNFLVFTEIEPFSSLKNKWIQGLAFSMGAWFCNVDDRSAVSGVSAETSTAVSNACARLRVRDHGPGGRQTLYDAAAAGTSGANGRGMRHFLIPSVGWRVGPYTFRAVGGFMRFNSSNRNGGGTGGIGIDHSADNFLIGHDLFLWSPKGFLTGSPSVPGSVLIGWHFERNQFRCGHTRPLAPCAAGTQFSRNRILLREWDIHYFVWNRASIGVHWLWYDASNLRSGDDQAQANLLGRAGTRTTPGKGGDWLDVYLNFRWHF